MKQNKINGFTLMELIVVIAIITLVTSLILVGLKNAQVQARHARRVADLKQIQKALQLYYQDHNDAYPVPAGCVVARPEKWDIQQLTPFLVPTYLEQLDNDPKVTNFNYVYYTFNCASNTYALLFTDGNDTGNSNYCFITAPEGTWTAPTIKYQPAEFPPSGLNLHKCTNF